MNPMAKLLVTVGVVLVIVGLLWQVGGKFLSLGRLPGDIVIKRENFSFYFPIMTSIVLSLVLSGIMYLLRFFR